MWLLDHIKICSFKASSCLDRASSPLFTITATFSQWWESSKVVSQFMIKSKKLSLSSLSELKYFCFRYATALAENLANPSHIMSFLLVFLFWLSWSPYIGIRIYQEITGNIIDNPLLHFSVVWIGIINALWKFPIMCMMSPQFRLALRIFFLTICCRTQGRLQAEILGLDPDD